jgi:hypothetical protein
MVFGRKNDEISVFSTMLYLDAAPKSVCRSSSVKMMKVLPSSIEILSEEMAAVLRLKTGAERLRIASLMFVSAREMLLNHLRAEHPDWEELRIHREAARRLSHGAV